MNLSKIKETFSIQIFTPLFIISKSNLKISIAMKHTQSITHIEIAYEYFFACVIKKLLFALILNQKI